jgi:hypothetical protein
MQGLDMDRADAAAVNLSRQPIPEEQGWRARVLSASSSGIGGCSRPSSMKGTSA